MPHEPPALFQHVAALVRGLDLVAEDVSKRLALYPMEKCGYTPTSPLAQFRACSTCANCVNPGPALGQPGAARPKNCINM